jgi:type I thyroxine 5'-deiodinase
MKSNETDGVCYAQPRKSEDRLAIARDFVSRFGYRIPLVVDPMSDLAKAAYAGWPERLYVLDERGRVAYKGKPGPFGYEPDEVETWLAEHLGPMPALAAPRAEAVAPADTESGVAPGGETGGETASTAGAPRLDAAAASRAPRAD